MIVSQKEKLISVIVTAYNIKEFLPRCLESLVKQTYKPLEIIIVDDGSTDGTARVCDDYASKYSFIKVLHKENGGPSSARNAGVKIAEGDYIGYVDGDDWVEAEMYTAMKEACAETNAEMAICSYRQHGKGAEQIKPTGNRIELSRQQALEWYICGHEQYHIYPCVWSKLFQRGIVEKIEFPEGHKSEDIMYTTWALANAEKCVFLDTAYYNYAVDRESSIMNSRLHERRFNDEIPFWKEQMRYLDQIGMKELAEKAAYYFYRRMLFYLIDFNERKMKASARQLMQMLYDEKGEIRRIYAENYVTKGDRVRMKLALAMPGFYCLTVKIYDKYVIPFRQRRT